MMAPTTAPARAAIWDLGLGPGRTRQTCLSFASAPLGSAGATTAGASWKWRASGSTMR